ncbi:sodium- and chloride-dependent GABA transporter 1-like [Haliotis asinina]|uniref:sodium- and chloride-dependent GABA transporter 1-like n=1 Tax=Haliotis asinina TaxID=109174 RepID=UPI00353180BF
MASNGGLHQDGTLKEEEEIETSVKARDEWGSAFLIPYFVGIITCGVPLFFLEVTIGQFSKMSAAHVWVICPLFKGIGIAQLLVSFMGSVLYIIVIAWSVYYLYRSFQSVLPWTACDNWWNTRLCVNRLGNVSISETYHNNGTKDQLLDVYSISCPRVE